MARLSKFFSQNKKILFFVIGLGLILTFLPWQSVEGGPDITIGGKEYDLLPGCGWLPHQWPRCIIGYISFIFLLPLKIIAAVIVLGLFFLALYQGLLFFLLGGIIATFIKQTLSVKVIPGAGIEILTIGWEFTRDFANMFLILILAIIGLATILKLREYEAKKMLPMLLIVALLINFSSVLVGFVVDIGNFVTNFFIERFAGLDLDTLKNVWDTAFTYLKDSSLAIFIPGRDPLADPFTQFGGIIGSIVYGLAILFFFVFGFWILVIVMLIFFLRVIVLWVLSILAPIAFLSRALPPTPIVKQLFPSIFHWDEWWKTLIQWTIIGIPIGFFLVLSQTLFSAGAMGGLGGFGLPTLEDPQLTDPGGWDVGWFANMTKFLPLIFAPLVGLILMGLGVLISMKSAPAMAQGIIKASSERGRAIAQRWVARGAAGVARGAATFRETYQISKGLGMTRREALSEATRDTAAYYRRRGVPIITPTTAPITIRGRRVVPGGRLAQVARIIGTPLIMATAATRGVLSATRDIAEAGIRASLRIKRRGMRPGGCPECGGAVAATAIACPHCGHVF